MHDEKTVQRFIELRVQGWVFTRIAAELNVIKTILIAWSHKHQHIIANLTAIEREIRFHKTHPDWFPPVSGGAGSPLPAAVDPDWEAAIRCAYGRHAVGGSITQNLTGENIPSHGQETVKFSRSALTCLLRIGWGDLSRLGNGERSSAEPKARSGPSEWGMSESTWPQAG